MADQKARLLIGFRIYNPRSYVRKAHRAVTKQLTDFKGNNSCCCRQNPWVADEFIAFYSELQFSIRGNAKHLNIYVKFFSFNVYALSLLFILKLGALLLKFGDFHMAFSKLAISFW